MLLIAALLVADVGLFLHGGADGTSSLWTGKSQTEQATEADRVRSAPPAGADGDAPAGSESASSAAERFLPDEGAFDSISPPGAADDADLIGLPVLPEGSVLGSDGDLGPARPGAATGDPADDGLGGAGSAGDTGSGEDDADGGTEGTGGSGGGEPSPGTPEPTTPEPTTPQPTTPEPTTPEPTTPEPTTPEPTTPEPTEPEPTEPEPTEEEPTEPEPTEEEPTENERPATP